MRRTWILQTVVLLLLLLVVAAFGCQEQPAPATPEEDYVPGQIIVKFKQETHVEVQERLNQNLGTTVIYTSPHWGFKVLQIPEDKIVDEMIAIYSEQSIVEYAEPNYVGRYNMPNK